MLVQKFGGTSLATTENLKSVANIIANTAKSSKMAIVLSAMGKVTDTLIKIIETAKNDGDWQSMIHLLESQHQKIFSTFTAPVKLKNKSN